MSAALVLPLLAAAAAAAAAFEHPKVVVNDISTKIADAMLECAKQMYPGLSFDREMLEFWNLDNDIENIKWGCITVCSMSKLKLCRENGQMNETNVKRLLLANGADEDTMRALLDTFQSCHSSSHLHNKSCGSGLAASKCFRGAVARLAWLPNF